MGQKEKKTMLAQPVRRSVNNNPVALRAQGETQGHYTNSWVAARAKLLLQLAPVEKVYDGRPPSVFIQFCHARVMRVDALSL